MENLHYSSPLMRTPCGTKEIKPFVQSAAELDITYDDQSRAFMNLIGKFYLDLTLSDACLLFPQHGRVVGSVWRPVLSAPQGSLYTEQNPVLEPSSFNCS